MFLILAAIIIVVCVYSVFTHNGKTLRNISTMSFKPNPESDLHEAVDITNDSSGILTEQSSMSDFTVNTVNGEDSQQISEMESEKETHEYSQMEIEEPPSFLSSQPNGPPRRTMKSYFKSVLTTLQGDDEDHDDVFEKKVKKPSSLDNNEPSASSSGNFRSNRKPRKPRKPRVRKNDKKITNSNGNSLIDWGQKQKDDVDKNSTDGESGKGADIGESQQATNWEDRSDSGCSTATTTNSEEQRGKKRSKHITICLDEDEPPVPKVVHEKLQIAGVNVQFPVKPYPSQIAVMNKLIQGCKKEEHCLLESPTGSGKTLALLCGVLAWQEHQKDEVRKQNAESRQKLEEHYREHDREYGTNVAAGGAETCIPSNEPGAKNDEPSSSAAPTECNNPDEFIEEFSDDEHQQPVVKKFCQSTSPAPSGEAEKAACTDAPDLEDAVEFFPQDFKILKTPTIYYGSRTHKQIEQVIRELKKTAYAFKRMTILSSREFTCIQNTDKNKTELCTNLLDPATGTGCQYFNEVSKGRISSTNALNRFGISGPWDIEDLVDIGRQQSACPYFAARDLMVEAEIVFCPYNYLVDPNIRQSMQINLAGQVVILDEAHNIEEMSREVGSLSFREDKITDVIKEAELLSVRRKNDYDTYFTIQQYLQNLVQFLKINSLNTVDTFSETASSDFWTGVQLAELFNIHAIGTSAAQRFQTAAGAAIMDFNSAKEEKSKQQRESYEPEPVITTIAKRFLEDLTLALQMMTSETLANDYRACIIENEVRDYHPDATKGWVHRGSTQSKRLRTLQMLCMNPAVIFSPLANLARCVVLASGTLSPISSFQSELGTKFPHKLDANHVVPKESVYIRGIPCGPTGFQLKANYTNVNSWTFQDELGRLILTVCRAVPHGVLCFFSSYSMMQKQIDRWKQNQCWNQLEAIKHVLQEPRGSSNLEPVMQEFRDIIRYTSDGPKKGITGALLFAVFRGKVAEGIDFSDNEARCVMAVGIPYAVRKDPSVDMKFNYNNLNLAKGLLKGGEWYAVQAFRALNQALGRCVRHRNDWGAVLLVDQRFLERTSYNYLPKWVKTMWRDSTRFNLARELEEFVATQIHRTREAEAESS